MLSNKSLGRKQSPIIVDTITGKKLSLKQFKKQSPLRLQEDYISKKDILKLQLVPSATVLETFIKKHTIHTIIKGRDMYVNRTELATALLKKS
ncbi:MAG: hypothetical protein NVSMB46_01960 [Candidatus Saccharimonadales bacterium]